MAIKSTHQEIKEEVDKAVKELQAALDAQLFYGISRPASKLLDVLAKLGVKSARQQLTVDGTLQMESLEHALDAVRYSFGKPDSLLMDPKQLDKFKKLKK